MLGVKVDKAVQEYISSLRVVGGVINTAIVMRATDSEGIISARDVSKLVSHGGHIDISKSWTKSLLHRMGYVKRKHPMLARYPLQSLEV